MIQTTETHPLHILALLPWPSATPKASKRSGTRAASMACSKPFCAAWKLKWIDRTGGSGGWSGAEWMQIPTSRVPRNVSESPVSKSRFNNPPKETWFNNHPKETSGSAFTIAMSFQVLVYSLHDLSEARMLWLGSSKHQHCLPLGFAAAPEPLWQSPPATCHQQKWWWTPSGVNHVWETSSWYVFKILLGLSGPLSAISTKETKATRSGNVSLQTDSVPLEFDNHVFVDKCGQFLSLIEIRKCTSCCDVYCQYCF